MNYITSVRICITALVLLTGHSHAASTWSEEGTQTFTVRPTGTLRIGAGVAIQIQVQEFVEMDTETVFDGSSSTDVLHHDSQKQWRLLNMSNNGAVLGAGNGPYTINISGQSTQNMNAGDTLELKFEYGDTRNVFDDRHDAFTDGPEVTIEIVGDGECPDGLTAAMNDVSGNRPDPAETFGDWEATMTAAGNPPQGRNNWNGVALTEVVGAPQFEPNKFVPINFNGSSGGTFHIGSAGVNKFIDRHTESSSSLILLAGVDSGSFTMSQTYKCTLNKTYGFTITNACQRLEPNTANERIKVTISK